MKSKRLRSPRYRPSDFRLGSVEAIYEHRFSANGRGEVLDFSGQGLALGVEEYMAEWYLHHRSPSDLVALATALPDGAKAEVIGEPLGVNLFLHVVKRAAAHVAEDDPAVSRLAAAE